MEEKQKDYIGYRESEEYKQLKEKERLEEYDKAIEDIVYREKLYHEFDI